MSVDGVERGATRPLLKAFGVAVTEYQERTRQLLDRRARARTTEEIERILHEAAEASADMNRRLQEITNYVLQLQSDFLVELVARDRTGDQPKAD